MFVSLALSEMMFPGEDPVRSKASVAITPLPFTGVRRTMAIRTVPGTFGFVAVKAPAMSGPSVTWGLASVAVSYTTMISSAAASSTPTPWSRNTPSPAEDIVTVDVAKTGKDRYCAGPA